MSTAVNCRPAPNETLTVSGTGESEVAALRELDRRLRDVPDPGYGRLDELRQRLRVAYIEGAEAWNQAELGGGSPLLSGGSYHPRQ